MTSHSLRSLSTASVVLAGLALPAAAEARTSTADGPAFVPGELIVGYVPRADASERREVRREEGLAREGSLPIPRVEKVEVGAHDSVLQVAQALEARPEVAYAQPNYYREPAAEPQDDELYSEQTALSEISAPEAWDVSKGGDGVVVAIVDDGVDVAHPDLDGNIWANPAESGAGADDGEDNDLNGYRDDHNGWDFTSNRPLDDSGSTDGCTQIGDGDVESDEGHGTHVAGIAGADEGDGGTVGVSWEVGLMPVKIFDDAYRTSAGNYATTDFDIACAFLYARDNGAKAINASFGGRGGAAPVLRDVIDESQDVLFVTAAGNDGSNLDAVPAEEQQFLCNLPNQNLVCVAAGEGERVRTRSNHGPESVDLAAPGSDVLSTDAGVGFTEDFESEVFSLASGDEGGWTTAGEGLVPSTWGSEQDAGGDFGIADSPSAAADVPVPYVSGADSHATSPAIPLAQRRGCSLEYGLRLDLAAPADETAAPDRLLLEVVGVDERLRTYDHTANTAGSTEVVRIPDEVLRQSGTGEVRLRFRLVDNGDSAVADGVHLDDLQVMCTHAFRSGTSMAAPHVAGVAALGFARAPDASPVGIKRALLAGVDPIEPFDTDDNPRPTATDGRLDAAATVSLLDPSQIPETALVDGPEELSTDGSPTFAFEADPATATFECRVGSDPFTACESGHRLGGLPDGRHVFQVRAVSPAGTPDDSPAERSFTVDTAGPQLGVPGRVRTAGRRDRTVRVTVFCRDAFAPPCVGNLRLRTAGRVDLGPGSARRYSLGSRTFTVRDGSSTATVKFRLSRAMARYVRDRGRLRLRADAVAVDSLGNRSSTGRRVLLLEG